MPLVGPREDEDPGAAPREGGTNLAVERARLGLLAVAEAVQPDLAQDERTIADEVLQPRQVRVEPVFRLEVDVEADEVEERQLEVLRGRVVDVRHEAVRILLLDDPAQSLQVPRGASRAEPTDERRRDLVPQRPTEEGRMTGTASDPRPDQRGDVRGALPVDEEAHVLLGRKPRHDPQAVA